MAKMLKTAWTSEYRNLSTIAREEHNEDNDCSVRALALTTGRSYSDCHAALKAAGRKDRKGSTIGQIMIAANELGFESKRWSSQGIVSMIHSYPKKGIAGITTHHPRRFPKQWGAVKGAHIFHVKGHVAAFVNGQVHDWSVNTSKQVIQIIAIYPIGSTPTER